MPQNKTSYKKTNIPWMPKIPKHWKMIKGKYVFTNIKELNSDLSENNRLSLTLKGVINRGINDNEGLNPLDFATYQKFTKNNLVFKLIDLENINTSRVGIVHENGIMSSAYIRLISTNLSYPKYHYYLYYNWYLQNVFNSLGSGVRATMSSKDLLNLVVPIPPLSEQKAIANYLDNKTAKIQKFIKNKTRLVELLKEKRQALIDAMVSGQLLMVHGKLEKPRETKPSGIDWLGDIPKHWEVRRLATIGNFSKGGNISKKHLVKDGEKDVVLYGDIYTKYEISTSKLINKISKEVSKKAKQIFTGDLLFTGSGEDKNDIGKCVVYLAEKEAYAGGDIIILRQNIFDSEFISYSQNSTLAKSQKSKSSKGDIIVHQYASKLKNILMPYPQKQEQKAIVQYIKKETQKIDKTIIKTQKEIALIKEYKEAMISEAVVGKLNING